MILRLPLVYGPGVAGNFLALLDEIARGHALPLGAIRNRRSVLGVGNLVEAIDAALDAPVPPRGVHFVADARACRCPSSRARSRPRSASRCACARCRCRCCGSPAWLSGRRASIERLTGSLEVDSSSFAAATGWHPRHSLAHGLVATAHWWRLRHSI